MCGPEITSNRNPSALQYTYAPRLAPERSTFSLNLCSGLVAGFVSTKTWPGDTDLPVPLPPMTTAQPLSESWRMGCRELVYALLLLVLWLNSVMPSDGLVHCLPSWLTATQTSLHEGPMTS